jgi:uncharacterized linocin/CFP29 family protein
MNHLHREIAPLDEEAWSQVDTDARTRLVTYLAGRRLVDFTGPLGWKHAAVSLGRVAAVDDASVPTVEAGLRRVLPLAEVRVPFTLSRGALDDAARGNDSIDLDGLDDAARTIATLENVAVFHAWAGAGIVGMTGASSHEPVSLGGDDSRNYPRLVATAVERLALAGIGGPYALALGDDAAAPSGAARSCRIWASCWRAARSCGPPVWTALWWPASAGATSSWSAARICPSATAPATSTP